MRRSLVELSRLPQVFHRIRLLTADEVSSFHCSPVRLSAGERRVKLRELRGVVCEASRCVKDMLNSLGGVMDEMESFVARTMFGRRRHMVVDGSGKEYMWIVGCRDGRSARVWDAVHGRDRVMYYHEMANLSCLFLRACSAVTVASSACTSACTSARVSAWHARYVSEAPP